MIPRRLSPRIGILLMLGMVLATAALSEARPGGGETYGGGAVPAGAGRELQ